jgi:glucokinase
MKPDPTILAIDIGGTSTKVGIVTAGPTLADVQVFPTGDRDPDALVENIRCCAVYTGISAVGVGVAGFVNPERDRLIYNPNLKWLVGFPLRDAIRTAFGVPVALEVDSNASCVAEYLYGSGRGSNRFLCLTAGTGLGGGMMVDGRLLRFNGGCLGDVGHMIVNSFGLPCSCGGRGCAEAFTSAGPLGKRAGYETFEAAVGAALHGDVRAGAEIASAGNIIGVTMASLAHVFGPDRIAIAGGVSEAGDLLLSAARDSFRYTAGSAYRNTEIVKAHFGWQAPLIGAAAVVGTTGSRQ